MVLNLLSLSDSLFLQLIFLNPEKSRKNTWLHLTDRYSHFAIGIWAVTYKPGAKLAGASGHQTPF